MQFLSCIFMSCIFMFCGVVRQFHVSHFHALRFGPWISYPAISWPASWYVIFMSDIFSLLLYFGSSISGPAFSVNPMRAIGYNDIQIFSTSILVSAGLTVACHVAWQKKYLFFNFQAGDFQTACMSTWRKTSFWLTSSLGTDFSARHQKINTGLGLQ